MDNHLPLELKEKITIVLQEVFQELANHPTRDYSERLALWQELHSCYLTTTAKQLEEWTQPQIPDTIASSSVVIEVTDDTTGTLFRRTLPIEYLETDNGIRLSGEAFDGTPVQIAFLSDTALTKIQDLLGFGPDSPRCQHET